MRLTSSFGVSVFHGIQAVAATGVPGVTSLATPSLERCEALGIAALLLLRGRGGLLGGLLFGLPAAVAGVLGELVDGARRRSEAERGVVPARIAGVEQPHCGLLHRVLRQSMPISTTAWRPLWSS